MLPEANGGPDHAIDRSRGGLSTKINALVDSRGLPVRIVLSPGQASDKVAVPRLFDGRSAGDVVADRGYDAKAILELVAAHGRTAHIPTCSDRRVQRIVDRELYRKRNLVERFFCDLKHFCRVATRFEKLAANYLAAVILAAARLWMWFESMTWPRSRMPGSVARQRSKGPMRSTSITRQKSEGSILCAMASRVLPAMPIGP